MLARRVSRDGWSTTRMVGILGLTVVLTTPVRAETAEPPSVDERWGAAVELNNVGSGELLWSSPRGLIPLPVLSIDVELRPVLRCTSRPFRLEPAQAIPNRDIAAPGSRASASSLISCLLPHSYSFRGRTVSRL